MTSRLVNNVIKSVLILHLIVQLSFVINFNRGMLTLILCSSLADIPNITLPASLKLCNHVTSDQSAMHMCMIYLFITAIPANKYPREMMETLPIVWYLGFGATFVTTPEISLPSQSFEAIWTPAGRVIKIFCVNVKNCRLY